MLTLLTLLTFDFRQQVAVVTGAGGGIGYTIAQRILAAGGSVLMIDNYGPRVVLMAGSC